MTGHQCLTKTESGYSLKLPPPLVIGGCASRGIATLPPKRKDRVQIEINFVNIVYFSIILRRNYGVVWE